MRSALHKGRQLMMSATMAQWEFRSAAWLLLPQSLLGSTFGARGGATKISGCLAFHSTTTFSTVGAAKPTFGRRGTKCALRKRPWKSCSEIEVQVQGIYNRIDEFKQMVDVAGQVVKVRTEAAMLADLQFEQNATLSSARSQSHADLASATASLLEANCGLSLAGLI